MKTLGVITEYNPFHHGHGYHLQKSIAQCSTDHTVCVMSGNFIQRGEPALMDKWARAEMAIRNGIDLVLELPVVYAMASAEYFASGAVKILDSLNIVDTLCFGSETGNLDELNLLAQILVDEPSSYKKALKEHLSKGVSFPVARQQAIKHFFKESSPYEGSIDPLMGSSNNILGIEYLKALKRLGSKIKPATILRIANDYHATALTGSISSATAIRKHIENHASFQEDSVLEEVLPKESLSILKREFALGRGPIFPAHFEKILLLWLRQITATQLKQRPYISEGLENRLKAAADRSGSFAELIANTATKRYPKTRIQRCLFGILTTLSASEFEHFNQHGGPQYIRVLGFNEKGKNLLSLIKKTASLPLITKTADYKVSPHPLLRRMLEIESIATDAYVLGYGNASLRSAGQEYTRSPFIQER